MRMGIRRFQSSLLPCLAVLVVAMPVARAAADTFGTALVVGIDDKDGKAGYTCSQAAHDVATRLAEQGMAVQPVTNSSAIELRSAIDDFAAGLEGAAPATALVYVCAPAVAVGPRLFVMPSGSGPDAGANPASQGVVVQAFLNALAGTGGTVFADLRLTTPADQAAPIQDDHMPAGLHLALNVSLRGDEASIGRNLASTRVELRQGWDAVAAGIAAGRPPGAVSLLPPPAGSMAPQATVDPTNQADAQTPNPARGDANSVLPPTAPSAAPGGDTATVPPADGNHPAQAATSNSPPARREARRARLASANGRTAAARPAARGRVERLQIALARKDFYHGPVDGRASPYTERGVRLFQHSLNTPETGTLTQAEIVRLLNE